ECGGYIADGADAENLFSILIEDEFEQAGSIAGNMAASVVGVAGPPYAIRNVLLPAGVFGFARGGDFRNRVDAHGQHGGHALFVGEAESVADGNSPLLHGGRSQRGKADDI